MDKTKREGTHVLQVLQVKPNMATRNPKSNVPMQECTPFVMHTCQTVNNNEKRQILDYTEHKLIRYANISTDAQQKLVLFALISDYREGKVAVGWRKGVPCYIKVTKDGQATPAPATVT